MANNPDAILVKESAEEIHQREIWEAALKFRNKEDGSLMTKKEILEFIKKQEMYNQAIIVASQPVYGEVSYDRAIGEILEKKESENDHEYGVRKSLALMLRKDEGETEEEI